MLKHKELTELILNAFYDVYRELGYGFLERVYQNAMYFALQDLGLKVEAQQRIKVYFRGREVGDFFADLVINDLVILELKATATLIEKHEVQLVNYLKATPIEIGFLLNFGTEPEFERKIWFNEKKKLRKS
jgi:GxxExxY protein